MMKETNGGFCVYCGALEQLTKDHIPPKCLFPRPRAPQITVAACNLCNQSFKKDDEHFAIAMTASAYIEHPSACQVWERSLRPMVLRGRGLRRMLSQNILENDVVTPAGVYVPDRRFIRFKKDRIDRVISRIVRGLLWHHYQVRPASDTEFEIYKDPSLNEQLADLINSITNLSWVGDDIFRYRHSLIEDDPNGSLWCFQFYKCNEFLVLVIGRSFIEQWTHSSVRQT
jgi:hypothetical protein